jgi:hypothetical protein
MNTTNVRDGKTSLPAISLRVTKLPQTVTRADTEHLPYIACTTSVQVRFDVK